MCTLKILNFGATVWRISAQTFDYKKTSKYFYCGIVPLWCHKLSLCPSWSGTVSKPLNISAQFLHQLVVLYETNCDQKFRQDHP